MTPLISHLDLDKECKANSFTYNLQFRFLYEWYQKHICANTFCNVDLYFWKTLFSKCMGYLANVNTWTVPQQHQLRDIRSHPIFPPSIQLHIIIISILWWDWQSQFKNVVWMSLVVFPSLFCMRESNKPSKAWICIITRVHTYLLSALPCIHSFIKCNFHFSKLTQKEKKRKKVTYLLYYSPLGGKWDEKSRQQKKIMCVPVPLPLFLLERKELFVLEK